MTFFSTSLNDKCTGTLSAVLISILLLTFISGCSEQKSAQEKPLNVLFILTDDQAPDTVSAFGNKNIHTPSINENIIIFYTGNIVMYIFIFFKMVES